MKNKVPIKTSFKAALFIIILGQLAGCAGPTTQIPKSSYEEIRREECIQKEMNQ